MICVPMNLKWIKNNSNILWHQKWLPNKRWSGSNSKILFSFFKWLWSSQRCLSLIRLLMFGYTKPHLGVMYSGDLFIYLFSICACFYYYHLMFFFSNKWLKKLLHFMIHNFWINHCHQGGVICNWIFDNFWLFYWVLEGDMLENKFFSHVQIDWWRYEKKDL